MNYQDIYTHLKAAGFAVYSLGQHQGECVSPYIVLRNNGSTDALSMTGTEYELLLYYPVKQYSSFEDHIESVKQHMNRLFPALRLVDGPSAHYLDDDVKGYMTSLIYENFKLSKINQIERT